MVEIVNDDSVKRGIVALDALGVKLQQLDRREVFVAKRLAHGDGA